MNKLYFGDNLHVLRKYIRDETVDLIYLDPPFNSNAEFFSKRLLQAVIERKSRLSTTRGLGAKRRSKPSTTSSPEAVHARRCCRPSDPLWVRTILQPTSS